MLIASLFVLSAVTVYGLPDDRHGQRRTKQLDIRDGQAPAKEPLDDNPAVVNGYLPPASPSSTIVGAQSLQTFDFQPLNSFDKENELCKSPSCDFNNGSSSNSKIPKPSRDLMPPFNDLDRETPAPTATTARHQKFTTPTPTKAPTTRTTTGTLATASSQQVTARIASKSSATTAKVLSSKGEATNELRSYLPPRPEFSAAAQTNIAVVQPAGGNNDHDHHHHHHGKDFDICADAFHSFLCAPLKARKRITGAFPDSLRGQSSFMNYQKLLPNYEREPAPSNALPNAYLPPKSSSAPANLIHSTPYTTRPIITPTVPSRPPPKTIPESSNSNNRFYLPPLSDNKILPAPSAQPALKSPPPRPTLRPAAITSPRTTPSTAFPSSSFSRSPPSLDRATSNPPVFHFSPSNDNRFYLPPSINPQPAPSFTAPSPSVRPTAPAISPQPSVPASLPAFTTSKPLPPLSAFTTAPTKSFTTAPTKSFTTASTKFFTTAAKLQPSTPSTPLTTSPTFQPPTRSLPSLTSASQKPLPSTQKPNAFPNFAGQSSGQDNSYLPPDTNLAAAAAQTNAAAAPPLTNPFHHGRDLCTDPFHSFLCVSAKPRKRITGQLPSGVAGDSTNTQESRLKPDSPDRQEKEPASAQTVAYKYPKPNQPVANVIPAAAPTSSAGYSYPKSEFPLQSPQNPQSAPAPTSTTAKPEPRPSETKAVSGYQYPKPDIPFSLPGEQSKVSPTTTSPTTTFPTTNSPTTTSPTTTSTTTTSPTTGYSYPKPQKPLPLPTEQKPLPQKPRQRLPPPKGDVASPTTPTKGYQYSKPDQSFKLPEKGSGYSYPKPTKRLELPTESRFKLGTSNPDVDPVGALGTSAEFIPVNKLDVKRSESKLVAGLRRFGERQKKRLREAYGGRKAAE